MATDNWINPHTRIEQESRRMYPFFRIFEKSNIASDSLFRHVRTTLPFLPVLLSGNFLRLRTG